MRNYQTKSNQGALPDSITSTRFGAGEFNSVAVELENAVSSSDQTLAPADGTGEVSDQLAKSLAIYGAGGAQYYVDTGAVNAYVLNPVSPKKAPPAYFDGLKITFEPGNENTGASTVNVASLGIKSITYQNGDALTGREISGSCTIKYNLSNDRFEIIFDNAQIVDQRGSVYTVFTKGPIGSQTYFAQANRDYGPSATFPNFSDTDFVDLMDNVMGVVGRNGTGFFEGNKVIIQGKTISLSKTWSIPPTQDFELDASAAVFAYQPVTGNAIEIDSFMNSYYKFGLIYANSGTSGDLVVINPATIGPDPFLGTPIGIASKFDFIGLYNKTAGGNNLVLLADTSGGSIVSNEFNIIETETDDIGLWISDTHVSAEVAYNVFNLTKFSDMATCVKLGNSTGNNNVFYNCFYGNIKVGGGTNIGIDCYGDYNSLFINVSDATAGNALILRSGAVGNNFYGSIEDGITNSSGVVSNRINPGKRVDRGDPSTDDFDETTLTQDGAWHDLDCSSIVPAGAYIIHFTCLVEHPSAGQRFQFIKKGNANTINIAGGITQVGGVQKRLNFSVYCDDAQTVRYFFESGVWTRIDLNVTGWEF